MYVFRSYRAAWLLTPLLLVGVIACRDGRKPMERVPTRPIEAVLADHMPSLMATEGVVAVGQGERSDGTPCIRVFLRSKNEPLMRRLPSRIEGHPVDVVVAGEIRAMPDSGR